MDEILSIKNLSKRYDDISVLENINLSVKKGEVVVIAGPSGCGKSTTLRMITGLDEPTSGDIYIDGKKINDLTPGKRDIAYALIKYYVCIDDLKEMDHHDCPMIDEF